MGTHILVPIDGSRPAWAALEHALTAHAPTALTVLSVIDPLEEMYLAEDQLEPATVTVARDHHEDRLEDARGRVRRTGFSGDLELVIKTGRPQAVIPEYADEEDVDQIVMGSTGRTGLERIVLGSVAEAVTRRSAVPVTTVRE